MLLDELWKEISTLVPPLKIVDYAIGVKYSYAVVKGEHGRAMGTSYFPVEDLTRGCSRVPQISSLGAMLSSTNIFEKSLGIAILNAISQYLLWNMNHWKKFELSYRNIVDEVARICKSGRKIVVIGNMVPLVSRLKEMGFEVTVLERNPRFRYGAIPDIFGPRIIPHADALIITGTTLLNDTLDSILHLGKNAKIRALIGPTAAVYPTPSLSSLTHIASLKIQDMDRVVETIKLGGGRWDFTPYAREYIIYGVKGK